MVTVISPLSTTGTVVSEITPKFGVTDKVSVGDGVTVGVDVDVLVGDIVKVEVADRNFVGVGVRG